MNKFQWNWVVSVATMMSVGGCDSFGFNPGGFGTQDRLPPWESLAIPKPSDALSGQVAQALCAEGTDAIDALEARIDALNGSQANDIALLASLYASSPTVVAGVASYEVNEGGRTLRVELVTNEDEVAITGTVDDAPYVAGAYQTDNSRGAITIETEEGTISSAWTSTAERLEIARTASTANGSLNAAVTVDVNKVRLATTDGDESLAAVWDRDSRSGSYASGAVNGCWEGATIAADMCTVVCTADQLDDLE
jgi:hypothetical protein